VPIQPAESASEKAPHPQELLEATISAIKVWIPAAPCLSAHVNMAHNASVQILVEQT